MASSVWTTRTVAGTVSELSGAFGRVLIGAWVGWSTLCILDVRCLGWRRLLRSLASTSAMEGAKRAASVLTCLHVEEVRDGLEVVNGVVGRRWEEAVLAASDSFSMRLRYLLQHLCTARQRQLETAKCVCVRKSGIVSMD